MLAAEPGYVAAQRPVTPPDSTAPPVAPAQPAPVVADSSHISARGAFLRSLVLPGWGQAYVGSAGRGVIYFSLEAGTLWMNYKTRRQLAAAREREHWMRETGQLGETERYSLLEARRSQAQDWFTLSLFMLLVSGADAYVAAQLGDFNQHIGVTPAPDGSVQLQVSVPLHHR